MAPFNTKDDSPSGLPDAKRRQFLVTAGSTVAEGRDTESRLKKQTLPTKGAVHD